MSGKNFWKRWFCGCNHNDQHCFHRHFPVRNHFFWTKSGFAQGSF